MTFLRKRAAALAVVVAAIGGCATVGTGDGVMSTQTRTGGFMGLSTKDNVETEYEQAFKGVTKVLIGGFKVGFNQSKRYENKRSGGLFRPDVRATGLVKLEGIDAEAQQRITDEFYAQFLALLAEKGYEVLPRETFTRVPEYSNVNETDFPYTDDQSGIFSSYGVGTIFSPTQLGGKQPFFPGEVDQGAFSGFSGMGLVNALSRFATHSDARVINVSFTVDFAGTSSGDFFSGKILEVGQLMSVDNAVLGITGGSTGVWAHRTGRLSLGQPVGSDIAFATVENVTSDTEAALETTANVVTGLLQGGLSGALRKSQNQTREYVFHAEREKYAEAARDALAKASKSMLEKMTQLAQK